MAFDVSDAFVRQYEGDVHVAYQRKGSKLRGTVRTVTGVVGESTTFQKVGKGTAGQKTRHGKVPTMNVDHTPVTCPLSDHYAGDWVDKLDEQKIKHNERMVLSDAGAFALGRKTDELIITAAAGGTNATPNTVQADGSTGSATGMNRGKALHAMTALGGRDVAVDGETYAWVGWKQWAELMTIEEFSKSDFVPAEQLPWTGGGFTGKRWLGSIWMPHSGLPIDGNNDRTCLWYDKRAIGHAIGVDVTADITWHGDHAAHFVNHMMSQGAVLIDNEGVQLIVCRE